jgi:hypothetical protein
MKYANARTEMNFLLWVHATEFVEMLASVKYETKPGFKTLYTYLCLLSPQNIQRKSSRDVMPDSITVTNLHLLTYLMIEVEFSGASLLLKLWRETEFCTNLST